MLPCIPYNQRPLGNHLVFPAKYRQAVFDSDVDKVLKDILGFLKMKQFIKISWIASVGLSSSNCRLGY